MGGDQGTKQWQVTCVCGWRTLGPKEKVVSDVIVHGRDTRAQDLTEEQAFSQAVAIA